MRWLFLLLSELEVEPDSEHYCTPEGTSPVGGFLAWLSRDFRIYCELVSYAI